MRNENIEKIEKYLFDFCSQSPKLLKRAIDDYKEVLKDKREYDEIEFGYIYPYCEYSNSELEYAIKLAKFLLNNFEVRGGI